MTALGFTISGRDADAAATEVKAILATLRTNADIAIRPLNEVVDDTEQRIDWGMVGALTGIVAVVLTLPSTITEVLNLVDRIKGKPKAEDAAARLQALPQRLEVTIHLVLPDGKTRPLADLTAEDLLPATHPDP